MAISRRKSVTINLNLDEIHILGERIIWKINMFLNLKYHVYGNDRNIIKKIKSYLNILNKISNLEQPKPLINDITVRLTANEVSLLWEIFNKMDSEYEYNLNYLRVGEDYINSTIESINRCNIFYGDLNYAQKIYIYLYTEIALCMRSSGNENIYIDGPLIRVRSTYIHEYLSDYTCMYEFNHIDHSDLDRCFYILEPRYIKPGEERIKFKQSTDYDTYSLNKITLKELQNAQDTIDRCNLDYNYILESNINNEMDDESEFIDNIESMIQDANYTLQYNDYGPGWRIHLLYNDFLDINGRPRCDFDINEDIIDKLNNFKFLKLNRSILSEEHLNKVISHRASILEELKNTHDRIYYSL